jgi:peptidoglycan/LPS O-acetylase OafA/YrhL
LFDQINGLPVHVLVLHAAVVFVPLLALGAIVYALVGPWRPKIGWAVLLLGIVAPICTFVAKESGEKLYDRLEPHMSAAGKKLLDEHLNFGTDTFFWTLGLGVVSIVMVVLTRREKNSAPKVVQWVLSAAMVVLALIAGYYIYRTGDSGAKAVWGTY